MTRLTRLCRALGVGLAVAAATLSVTGVAQAESTPPPLAADPRIAIDAGNKVFLVGHAKGVQIYTCNGTAWVLPSSPRADLVDDGGRLVTTHFGTPTGPRWKATDGSIVQGTVTGRLPSPAAGPAIDWLRLSTVSVGSPGLLSDTTFIQRVETKGGTTPPAAACKAQTLNKVVEVPYKADYYFYKKATAGA